MRAEVREGRITFTVSDLDSKTGARVAEKYATYSYDTDNGDEVYFHSTTIDGQTVGTYATGKAVVKKVLTFTKNAEAADWTDFTLTFYDEKGRYVTEWTYSEDSDGDLGNVVVGDGYTVEISLLVDDMVAGELTSVKGGDDEDDRNQAVITVLFQHAVGSSLYDKPNANSYYVVNKGENVAELIEDGTYYNFPGWDEYTWSDDKEYIRVYSDSLAKVTGDIEVKADWAEDKAGLDRFAPAATNDKDTNGDGKVSCDEYYGTTGLEWSDKLNACVVSSTGDAVVTIPNTATK